MNIRLSISAPGDLDRGSICDVFCVVAQEYGDAQVIIINSI